jgi:hypothetical protein
VRKKDKCASATYSHITSTSSPTYSFIFERRQFPLVPDFATRYGGEKEGHENDKAKEELD